VVVLLAPPASHAPYPAHPAAPACPLPAPVSSDRLVAGSGGGSKCKARGKPRIGSVSKAAGKCVGLTCSQARLPQSRQDELVSPLPIALIPTTSFTKPSSFKVLSRSAREAESAYDSPLVRFLALLAVNSANHDAYKRTRLQTPILRQYVAIAI
jgi:hypothetical protein